MIINDVELEYDAFDVGMVERTEKAYENLRDFDFDSENGDIKKLRSACQALFDFFDTIFGDGTAKKIFGDKVSFALCVDALETFENQHAEQISQLKKKSERIIQSRNSRNQT